MQPAQRGNPLWGGGVIANHSFWWEPNLSYYNENEIMLRYGGKINFLQKSQSLHTKPDLLLLKGKYESLPFPASGGKLIASILTKEEFKKYQEVFGNIAKDILWLIECKDYEPEEQDLTRFIWYAVTYQLSSMLVIQGSFPPWFRERFNEDVLTLNQSGIRVEVIEHFDIGERIYCLSKLSSVF